MLLSAIENYEDIGFKILINSHYYSDGIVIRYLYTSKK
jgi:ribosomal protein S18 acetylase RimI-like enzyme